MKTNAMILGFSTISLAASMGHAQVGTPADLGSSNNFIMGNVPDSNGSCPPLTGVVVTLTVTDDIVVNTSSTTCSDKGYSMQLNANGPPSASLKFSQAVWQQYVIVVAQEVQGFTQLWGNNANDTHTLIPTSVNPGNIGAPHPITNPLTIPRGTQFTWTLDTDANGNVTEIVYAASDPLLTAYTPVTMSIPEADRAPVISFELDIVGDGSPAGCDSTFQSGAGTITYQAKTPFSPLKAIPSCATAAAFGRGFTTGESSDNSAYGLMSYSSGQSFTQEFYLSSPYKWQSISLAQPSGNASPTILGDESSPVNLDSGGFNAVTLAPGNLGNMSWLSSAEGPLGNAQKNTCIYEPTLGTTCNKDTGFYDWGLALGTDGSSFGWTLAGQVWLDDVNTGWGAGAQNTPGLGFYTSVAPVTANDVFLTNSSDTSCLGTGTTDGACIYHSKNGAVPTKWHNFGATQVTVDSTQMDTDLFAIDEVTNTVYAIPTTGANPAAVALPRAICGGGTLVADQIAVKGGVVFAIQDNKDLGGRVYAYTPANPTCPGDRSASGWTPVGTRSGFVSIATDQLGLESGCAVWATDADDTAWCACRGSAACTPFPLVQAPQ